LVIRASTTVRWPVWIILAALIAAGGALHPSDIQSPYDPLRPVVRAVSAAVSRDIAARLSGGFAWAPLRVGPVADDSTKSSASALRVAASQLTQQRGDLSPATRHALAVCKLLLGRTHDAVTSIAALTREHPGAATWNDLAAAQLAAAGSEDDPAGLGRALAAADAALERAPELPEARFNRALILERLGLRDQARDDWQTYLRLDSASGWAAEARQHVRALQRQEPFAVLFAKRHVQLLADPAGVRPLVNAYPQESRVAGEEEVLADWGEAILCGDDAKALRNLALAREIGSEQLRNGGDGMLAAMADSIQRAGPAERVALANAHLHFRQGRQLYRNREVQAAERMLTASAAEFARGNSPGALMARAFTANTIFEDLRVAEAGERLQRILSEADLRFPALRAGVLWEWGGVASAAGRWGASLEAFGESAAIFERLGERNYAAVVRGVLASVYARVGEPRQAWKHRMRALEELGRTPSFRLHQAIDAVTQAALADGDWPVALSFLGVDIDLAERMGDAQVTIESRLSRAELRARQHQEVAAQDDLREAGRLIERLNSPADRRHYSANAKAVQALLPGSPIAAAALLTDAIDFHGSVGRRMHLPWLMMLRGRAYRAANDDVRARRDFESGVRELEKHRESLAAGEDRWGVFHDADDLFAAAIALALDQSDSQRAFEYAERERARGLLDTLGASWRPVAASDIPAGTTVVEYAAYENMLVIFTLDVHGVQAVRQNVSRETLRGEIASFNEAIASADAARINESGRVLYQRLLAPVASAFSHAKRIAFVPDPRLDSLPFAALPSGPREFLVERYALTVEPSAAVFTRLRKPAERMAERHVLIVTGSEEAARLPFAEGEARAVARQFLHVTRLSRESATAAAFAREAMSADVIHFVGHGVASTGARESGYLDLRSPDAIEDRLDVKRITALRLPHTALVVLAACVTAAGESRSTEGTISVARAFLAAGVPSVVATLRPIADEQAAVFYPRFHRHVASGLSPAEALRQTQLEWITRGDGATAMWAAVQVIGE
jgi:CHAT domain-containing protein